MPIIRPISDLRNNFNMISEICHKEGEPVFITKNGQGDLVVMSLAIYEKQKSLLELYQKLGEAEIESASGAKTISHAEMMKKLKEKVNG
jgi:prevent-host-death family protein